MMRRSARRRSGSPARWALLLVLGVPVAAEAQQMGLFPLAPIRRQRPPCPHEDPVYRLYRQEYFGYHPTCWRRFPPGWGCPSPEAPNAAAEFKRQPLDTSLSGEGGPPPEGPEGGAMPEGPNAPGAEAPGTLPPLPGGARSPFELDTKPAGPIAPNPPADRNRPLPDQGPNLPGLPPPSEPADPPTPARVSRHEPAADAPAEGETTPLLALPDPALPRDSEASTETFGGVASLDATNGPVSGAAGYPDPSSVATPAQPPRQGLLSRLFGGWGWGRSVR
jgi:hypothetical protein